MARRDILQYRKKDKNLSKIRITEITDDSITIAITISGLCGHYFASNTYAVQAEKLMSYGLICLRSQRNYRGEFWEQWYLSRLWAAQGDLKDAVASREDVDPYSFQESQLDRALFF